MNPELVLLRQISGNCRTHSGSSVSGQFVYTVNTVDIATGWTEQRAVGVRVKEVFLKLLNPSGNLFRLRYWALIVIMAVNY